MASKFDVFLSYNESDLALVNRIMNILNRMGITTYSYKHYPEYGEYLPEIIKKNIMSSEFFVVLLTRAGIDSQWVNQEIGMAFALNRLIIPIVQMGLETKGFVELRQHIDYNTYNPEQTLQNIIYRLRYLCNATTIQLKCKNEDCRHSFSAHLPSEMDIGEAVKKKNVFLLKCPRCKKKVTYSPITFEQEESLP